MIIINIIQLLNSSRLRLRWFAWVVPWSIVSLWSAGLRADEDLSVDENARTKLTVVASIKPLHSIVSAIVGEVGDAHLLLADNQSPHHFQLKPSTMRLLNSADAVFYFSGDLETTLESIKERSDHGRRYRPVIEAPNLKLLTIRSAGVWSASANQAETVPHHPRTDSVYPSAEEYSEHSEHADHPSGGQDVHLWLDVPNMKQIARYIAWTLSQIYPQKDKVFDDNLRQLLIQLDDLHLNLQQLFSSVVERRFVVSHDALQYLEHNYHLNVVGALSASAHQATVPKQIRSLIRYLDAQHANCLLIETGFSKKLVKMVQERTGLPATEIDFLGVGLPVGPRLYNQMMLRLARQINTCANDNP